MVTAAGGSQKLGTKKKQSCVHFKVVYMTSQTPTAGCTPQKLGTKKKKESQGDSARVAPTFLTAKKRAWHKNSSKKNA